jgi:adenine deaminase
LVTEGHIDHCVRKAITAGMDPMAAVQIATINTARHYRLRNFGAIAPRFWADMVVVDDLKNFVIRQTYKKGILVAENGKYLAAQPPASPPPRSTMNIRFEAARDFAIQPKGASNMRVIEVVPNQIVTREAMEKPRIEHGQVVSDVTRDILKLVVLERHQATGNVGVGFVRGFKLRTGALGSTVAHDAHNVVVVGVSDEDIHAAVIALEKMKGGQVAVSDRQVKAELPLPIAGLVSELPLPDVIEGIANLNRAARDMGCDLEAPFMTLSFLSLSPIPELKLTDQGLIDAVRMRKTSLWVED